MINVPDEVKALLDKGSVAKNFRVHFPNGEHSDLTNANIVSESVEFTESLCSQDELKFGLCEASTISFETFGVGNIKGKTIDCSLEIDCRGLDSEFIDEYCTTPSDLGFPVYSIPYGQFVVDSCPRDSANMQKRKITAYTPDGFSTYSDNLPANSLIWEYTTRVVASKSAYGDVVHHDTSLLADAFVAKQIEPSGTVYRINSESQRSVFPYGYITYNTGIITPRTCHVSYTAAKFFCTADFDRDTPSSLPDNTYVCALRALKVTDRCIDRMNRDLQTLKSVIYSDPDLNSSEAMQTFSICVSYIIKYSSIPLSVTTNDRGFYTDARYVGNLLYPLHTTTHTSSLTYPLYIANTVITNNWTIVCQDVYTHVTYTARKTVNNVAYDIYTFEYDVEFEDADGISFDIIESDFPRINYKLTYNRTNEVTEGDYYMYDLENNIWETLKGDCREMIQACAELSGAFFKLSRTTNKLALFDINRSLGLYPSNVLFPNDTVYPAGGDSMYSKMLDMSQYSRAWYDDLPTKRYSAVVCTYKDSDGVEHTEYHDIVDLTITDEADNLVFNPSDYQEYDISDNEIISSNAYTQEQIQEILRTIADRISNVQYMPADIDCIGLPYIEVGDGIDVLTADGGFETLVLRRTLSGIHALTDNIESK